MAAAIAVLLNAHNANALNVVFSLADWLSQVVESVIVSPVEGNLNQYSTLQISQKVLCVRLQSGLSLWISIAMVSRLTF